MLDAGSSGVFLGLASALFWGTSDFTGGFATRRGNVYAVLILMKMIGFFIIAGLSLVSAEVLPSFESVMWASLAGASGGLGLIALYTGLSGGRMGIIAPLSALVTGVVPVLMAALLEGLPSIRQFIGFGIALTAVWLMSSSSADGQRIRLRDYQLSVMAGLGFGFLFVFLDRIDELGVLWSLAAVRLAATVALLLVSLALRAGGLPAREQMVFILLTAVCDTTGDGLFTLAARFGRLDVAAVLGSLYPAATVSLAWLVLKEKIYRRQWAGITAALLAVVLITS